MTSCVRGLMVVVLGLTASGGVAAPASALAAPAAQGAPGLDAFAEQLRYLGYEVTQETTKDGEIVKATHERRLNFTLRAVGGGVMLLAYFEGSLDVLDEPRLQLVQQLNKEATCARYYWDDEFDLIVEGWYPGEHDQQRFSTFMDAWHGDGDRVLSAPGLTDLVE